MVRDDVGRPGAADRDSALGRGAYSRDYCLTYAELVAPIANRALLGSADCMPEIPDGSVHCVVTSPPYFRQRGYLDDDDPAKPLELGQEAMVDEYAAKIVAVFREVRRILRDDGTVFLNLGDCYASAPLGSHGDRSTLEGSRPAAALRGVDKRGVGHGIKPKDLIGVPWMVAFALRADGWWLRDEIVWHKPNPMTSPADDRCTNAHEKVFMLAKRERYFVDMDAVRSRSTSDEHGIRYGQYEPPANGGNPDRVDRGRGRFLSDPLGANLRNVWTIATAAYRGDHHAVMPLELARRCIRIGTSDAGCCATCGAPRRRQPGFFEPGCSCNAPTMPSLVADPFLGTGTTAEAAESFGMRMWTGYELNARYHELLSDRTRQIGLFSA